MAHILPELSCPCTLNILSMQTIQLLMICSMPHCSSCSNAKADTADFSKVKRRGKRVKIS